MAVSPDPDLFYIAHDDFLAQVREVARQVAAAPVRPDHVVGIGRGGLVPAVYISHQLDLPMLSIDQSAAVSGGADTLLAMIAARSAAGTRFLFVDDINDTGGTIASIRAQLAAHGCDERSLTFAVLINNTRSRAQVDHLAETIDRTEDKRWFVFPWEAAGNRAAIVEDALSVPERLA